MKALIGRIRERLAQSAYVNEAAISHGVVTPILNALGWDSADPAQLVPEYAIPQRGRVDFALFGLGHRPAVFIEVKGVGRAVEGDRQLFEYAFHEGVPLCVLTDGREWSFYLPAAQGSYEDRRVYRLQLDDRDPAECERVLTRYLARDRVRGGKAFEDAQADYRDAAGRREANATVHRAWADLAAEPNELLMERLAERTEALCGFRPERAQLQGYLRSLAPGANAAGKLAARSAPPPGTATPVVALNSEPDLPPASRSVRFKMLGQSYECHTASLALIEVLRVLAARDPGKVPELAQAVKGRTRSMIARTTAEINPQRPDLAKAAEFAPGWLIGLNTSNREKTGIIRTACAVFGLTIPNDLDIVLPNA